jgi:glycine cleavage system H protein
MNIPENLKYTQDHEWARLEKDVLTVGITDYAQGELGDIVYIELPEEGAEVSRGESFGTIEAVKAVSDLYAPVSGTVIKVNKALANSPETVNADPYGEGWMIQIKISNSQEIDDLLTSRQYQELI